MVYRCCSHQSSSFCMFLLLLWIVMFAVSAVWKKGSEFFRHTPCVLPLIHLQVSQMASGHDTQLTAFSVDIRLPAPQFHSQFRWSGSHCSFYGFVAEVNGLSTTLLDCIKRWKWTTNHVVIGKCQEGLRFSAGQILSSCFSFSVNNLNMNGRSVQNMMLGTGMRMRIPIQVWGFPKKGYPEIIHFMGCSLLNHPVWDSPFFRKPPYKTSILQPAIMDEKKVSWVSWTAPIIRNQLGNTPHLWPYDFRFNFTVCIFSHWELRNCPRHVRPVRWVMFRPVGLGDLHGSMDL